LLLWHHNGASDGYDNGSQKNETLAKELAKDIKSPEDLAAFSAQLTKITVEAVLNAEMVHHLGYAPHDRESYNTGNTRNWTMTMTLKDNHGEIMIEAPRDRAGSFAPQIVRKDQARITGMGDQILASILAV